MTLSHRLHASIPAALACALASPGVFAQPSTCPQQTRADSLEEEGRALRQSQRDVEALERFRQAFALCHGARALARAGLAEGSLGLWLEAQRDVMQALTIREPWVRENESRLLSDLETIRGHLGQLELIGDGPPGELVINGRTAGAWPRTGSFPVVAGTVVVEVRSPQHELFRRSIEVPPRTLVREQVRLVPHAGGATARPETVLQTGPGPAAVVVPPPVNTPRETSWQVPVGWTAVGLAAAGVGVGVAGLLHAQARRSTYDNDARCTPRETDATYCASIIDGVDAGRAMTIAGFVSGGVLAVLGTVLLVTAPSRSGGGARAWSCAPAAGGDGGGLTCAVRF